MSRRKNGYAEAAGQRRSATFKHRNEPRQGAKNESRDLLDWAESEKEPEPVSLYDLLDELSEDGA